MSIVSYIEVLGYHQLKEEERGLLEQFFQAAKVLPLSDEIAERAVRLRRQRRMSLGDAIAGTALAHTLTLVTHNTDDFTCINELKVFDPLEREPGEGGSTDAKG